MKRAVMFLALAASTMAAGAAFAAGEDEVSEDEAIDRAIAAAEEAALSPPAPLPVRREKPLVTAPAPEGLGIGAKLALCAAVGGAGFWLVRTRMASRDKPGGAPSPGGKPRVLSRTPVGLRHEVVVLEVEGQRFLLGVAPGSIASLGLLPDEPVLADAVAERDALRREDPRRDDPRRDDPRRGPEPERDRGAPLSESLSRLIAASRDSNTPRPVSRSLLASAVHERARPAPFLDDDDDEVEPARRTPEPPPARRRAGRQTSIANDTNAEGQVRGLRSRRAVP